MATAHNSGSEAFPGIGKIRYEGPASKSMLAFRHYDPDAVENALSDKLLLQKIIAHARLSSRHVQVLSAILREQSEISLGRELGISKQKINVDKMEMLSILRRYCESQTRKPPAKVLTAPS